MLVGSRGVGKREITRVTPSASQTFSPCRNSFGDDFTATDTARKRAG
jgi:hypothetical protein